MCVCGGGGEGPLPPSRPSRSRCICVVVVGGSGRVLWLHYEGGGLSSLPSLFSAAGKKALTEGGPSTGGGGLARLLSMLQGSYMDGLGCRQGKVWGCSQGSGHHLLKVSGADRVQHGSIGGWACSAGLCGHHAGHATLLFDPSGSCLCIVVPSGRITACALMYADV